MNIFKWRPKTITLDGQPSVLEGESKDTWRINRIHAVEENIFALGRSDPYANIKTAHSEIHAATVQALTFRNDPSARARQGKNHDRPRNSNPIRKAGWQPARRLPIGARSSFCKPAPNPTPQTGANITIMPSLPLLLTLSAAVTLAQKDPPEIIPPNFTHRDILTVDRMGLRMSRCNRRAETVRTQTEGGFGARGEVRRGR